MPPAGFEAAILASERPQTHDLDRAATGVGRQLHISYKSFQMYKGLIKVHIWLAKRGDGNSTQSILRKVVYHKAIWWLTPSVKIMRISIQLKVCTYRGRARLIAVCPSRRITTTSVREQHIANIGFKPFNLCIFVLTPLTINITYYFMSSFSV